MSTAKVTLAYPYTDAAGNEHDADASVELPEQEAHDLVHAGRARTESKPTRTAKEK